VRIATTISIVAACAIGLGVLWLLLGSRIVLVLDRMFPGPFVAKDIGELLIDTDTFILGDRRWPLPGLTLTLDPQSRIVLSADGRTFTLGPVRTRWQDPVNPQYQFVPEPGDEVAFTRDVSRLNWHTPFAFSFGGGTQPKSHRYAYDRLRWKKQSGARLEIVWRDEQNFYQSSNWQDSYNIKFQRVSIF
jgi:hypothetical protein